MRIFNVPIEPLEERYSSQWYTWFCRDFDRAGINHVDIVVMPLTNTIETGQFLDVHGTNYYKAEQLAVLCKLLYKGDVKDGDWIFFHDLWFPGIEMLAYIRDATGVKFKIAGCLHAGTWDHWDFISRVGMQNWACHFEEALFELIDLAFVATDFHRRLITAEHPTRDDKLVVTGFPIYPAEFVYADPCKKDPSLVVFPHRLTVEKGLGIWKQMVGSAARLGLRMVATAEVCKTKAEYYQLLARATYAVSFAMQETWGIAMQEALFSGCICLVPDRLSYQEMYPDGLRLKDSDAVLPTILKCHEIENTKQRFQGFCDSACHVLAEDGEEAIDNMIQEMQSHAG